jgi:UDP-glucose 4-epimerase
LKHQVPRLLYASSMSAYGNRGVIPTPETEPLQPNSYYGITKGAGEQFVHATAERSDLGFAFNVTSLRMFSVYGPGQALDNPYQGVLGIFIGKLLRNEPITIFGDGEQTRDFVYIDDIVDGWVRALDNPAAHGGIFNLGSGRSLSIKQLAEHAIVAFGHPRGGYEIIYGAARPGEQSRVQADIRRAQTILGWEPRTSFESGLAETIRWGRSSYSGDPTDVAAGRGMP